MTREALMVCDVVVGSFETSPPFLLLSIRCQNLALAPRTKRQRQERGPGVVDNHSFLLIPHVHCVGMSPILASGDGGNELCVIFATNNQTAATD